MLRNAGVGEAIRAATAGHGINLLLLGWLVALIIRIAQGSATVAMLTTAAMMEPLLGDLTCHRMYLFLAIGFGAFACSWMNDSGFWVVSRLSGFTEKETLRTWTVSLTIVSIIGLLLTLGMAAVWPGL
jgi:GntP family gluconate:H+ symporter